MCGYHISKQDKIFYILSCTDVSLEESLYFYNDKSLEPAVDILRESGFIEFYRKGGVWDIASANVFVECQYITVSRNIYLHFLFGFWGSKVQIM